VPDLSGRPRLAYHLATTFGLGDRVLAPGTFAGSLPAAVLWLGLATAVAPVLLGILTGVLVAAATAAGIWAAGLEEARRGSTDPGPVVIDEVAGQWLTYLVALHRLPATGAAGLLLFVLAGFVSFRLFDIVKPWPVHRLERLHGGTGIMVDDLAAALWAGLLLFISMPWLARLLA
jgi:phosphatidylglycerophosphatase A